MLWTTYVHDPHKLCVQIYEIHQDSNRHAISCHIYTTGAPPRRPNACPGSRHARNTLAMYDTYYTQNNRRCKCDSTAKGYVERKTCLNTRKIKLESDAVNHGNRFCHPAHDNEQQQQAATAAQQHTRQKQAGKYEYILVLRAVAYNCSICPRKNSIMKWSLMPNSS